MTKVLYPGSFDPITKGHMNIIEQASNLFDEVVIAIMVNPIKKNFFFAKEERLEMISKLYKDIKNLKVISETGAAVDAAIIHNCNAIVRGLRGLTDFDYEIQLSQINKDISNNKVGTICLFADKNYQFISSTMVKEVFNLNKSVSNYVDSLIEAKMLIKRK